MITIRKVRLENFRSYDGDNNEMEISDLTALVGKNDAGKSTWLEALSIFFNPTGVCKPEANDLNIYSESGTFGIAVSFDLEDSQIVIDTANVVDAKEEYLLDSKGFVDNKEKFLLQ
ncbi:MAG: AAA family ATPase [Acidimicrobiia bacterium]